MRRRQATALDVMCLRSLHRKHALSDAAVSRAQEDTGVGAEDGGERSGGRMGEECVNCGKLKGQHSAWYFRCPTGKDTFDISHHFMPRQNASPKRDDETGSVELPPNAIPVEQFIADFINHPPHYTTHPSGVECLTIARHMAYNIGAAMKYMWRAGRKGDAVEDLKKARFHLADEIRRLGGDPDK